MSRDCLDAGLVGAELLEERVICLQIQHACALPICQRGARRRLVGTERVCQIILDVEIDVMRMIHVRVLIVRMVLVVAARRIVVGEYQIGIVVINDNIWFLCRPVLGDDLHVGLVVRSRLLVGRREVVVHPIEAAVVAVEHVRQNVLVVVRFRDDVAKVVVAVGIVVVDDDVAVIGGRRLIALILVIIVAGAGAATRAHQQLIVVGYLQVEWEGRILMVC